MDVKGSGDSVDAIMDCTLQERLDQLEADLYQDMLTTQETAKKWADAAAKAAGRYSIFMMLKTGSVPALDGCADQPGEGK
jgi:hypothetical protein